MFKRVTAVAGLALLGMTAGAQAQTATAAVSVSVAPVLVMNTAGSFTFPAATDAAYTAGSLASTAGPTLTHRANVPYKITIEAQSGSALAFANYVGRSDTDPTKPIGDLSIESTISGTPTSSAVGASGSAADFYTRAARGGTLSSALTARLALDYANDPPGTYSTTVLFTMVAQ